MPGVSVIVPVRDDPRVDDLLRSLDAQQGGPPFEVLVALDGSTREPRLPSTLTVRLLPGPHRGPAAARNRAIREARGDLLLLTDSDCLCPPDWVGNAVAEFGDPGLKVLQGGSVPAESTRLSLWIQREYERYVASHAATGFRHFCNTRNLALRRDVALAFPFRETFLRGSDGVYGLQLAQAGIPIRHSPAWAIAHRHPRSRWREGWVAFEQGRQGAHWASAGFELFAEPDTAPPRGPGAWLVREIPHSPAPRLAAGVGLLGLAMLLGAASAALSGGAGYRVFSRFRRAAHLAGRLVGESEMIREA